MFLEAVSRGVEIDAIVMEDVFYEKGLSPALEQVFSDYEDSLGAKKEAAGILPSDINIVWSGFFKHLITTATSCGMVATGVQIEATIDNVLEDCRRRKAEGLPSTVVILEGIQDPGNLGTIIRSALAFEASGVILTKGTVDPYNPKVVRSAMGALFDIPVVLDASLQDTVAMLKAEGFSVCALNPEAEQSLSQAKLPSDLVLLLGNEGAGLSQTATALADLDLKINISPLIESLNVSIAAAVVLFHLANDKNR
ncbi:MAG: RNA methyltransferase [Cyanobacteria bacterium REEB67]|nr:RNA methyltransferase [Cyanobacteria bacterium REEB67]